MALTALRILHWHISMRFMIWTAMLGHKTDPVTGGVQYRGFSWKLPDAPGIEFADADDNFRGNAAGSASIIRSHNAR